MFLDADWSARNKVLGCLKARHVCPCERETQVVVVALPGCVATPQLPRTRCQPFLPSYVSAATASAARHHSFCCPGSLLALGKAIPGRNQGPCCCETCRYRSFCCQDASYAGSAPHFPLLPRFLLVLAEVATPTAIDHKSIAASIAAGTTLAVTSPTAKVSAENISAAKGYCCHSPWSDCVGCQDPRCLKPCCKGSCYQGC